MIASCDFCNTPEPSRGTVEWDAWFELEAQATVHTKDPELDDGNAEAELWVCPACFHEHFTVVDNEGEADDVSAR